MSCSSFDWVIDSHLLTNESKEFIKSPVFGPSCCQWGLSIFPKGYESDSKYLSVFLWYMTDKITRNVQYTISIATKDCGELPMKSRTSKFNFTKQEGRGFPKFIKWDLLQDAIDANTQFVIRVELCELTLGECLPLGIALQEVTNRGDVDILTKENLEGSTFCLRAHRNVLCTLPYFDRKLNGTLRKKRNTLSTASLTTLVDAKRPSIDLQKFSRDAVSAMLEFVYDREIKKTMPKSINTRCEIYALAHYTENKALLSYMTNKITKENLQFNTLFDLLTIPNIDPVDGLYPRCLEFFNHKITETSSIPNLQAKLYDMDKQTLIDLLQISLSNLHTK